MCCIIRKVIRESFFSHNTDNLKLVVKVNISTFVSMNGKNGFHWQWAKITKEKNFLAQITTMFEFNSDVK